MSTKLVFVSNYFNHHQQPLCDELYRLLDGSFVFLQTEEMEEERVKMGWKAPERAYVQYAWGNRERAATLLLEAEVVLFGGVEDASYEQYVHKRLLAGKPVIRYSERLYREAQWKAISPRGLLQKWKDHTRFRKAPLYLLCSGAYVADDFRIIHAYPRKMMRYGYFPEAKKYASVENLMEGKEPASILWAARMIPLKHGEIALEVASYLKQKGIHFQMKLFGGGPMEEELKSSVVARKLSDQVHFLGFQPTEVVRMEMEKSSIFLMTSDRNEGWGAVVNEAMNSGCVVVADHMVGATPYLIKDGENGCIYRDGDVDELCRTVEALLLHPEQARKLGEAAYATIENLWNPETAASRLVALREAVLVGESAVQALVAEWDDGPCSKTPVIRERKMYAFLKKNSR